MEQYDRSPAVALAALSLVESLLISLRDSSALSEKDLIDIRDDVVAAHRHAAAAGDKVLHDAVADLVSGIGSSADGTYALRPPRVR